MKTWLAVLLVITAFSRHAHADEEIMPLEKRIGLHWNSVKIAYGTDNECTGLGLGGEFTITRDGANMTISTTTMVIGWRPSPAHRPEMKLISTSPVRLSHEAYGVMMEGFLGHVGHAGKEMDVHENLAAYPGAIPFEEVRKRMAERGEIAGAKAAGFLVVIFNPGAKEQKYIDAFVKPESRESYVKWLHDYRRYAAPGLVE